MKKIETLLNDPAVAKLNDACPLWATKIAGNYSLGEIRRLVARLNELEKAVSDAGWKEDYYRNMEDNNRNEGW